MEDNKKEELNVGETILGIAIIATGMLLSYKLGRLVERSENRIIFKIL